MNRCTNQLLAGLLVLAMLSACGGGGGGDSTAAPPSPPSGSLDTGFGNGTGMVTTHLGSDFDDATALALQPDGKMIIAGYVDGGSSQRDFAVARYDANGMLDLGFGTNGVAKTDLNGQNEFDKGYAVALQADGKILQAGFSGPGGNSNFALVRYLSNGTLDNVAPSFSGNGIVKTDLNGTTDIASSVAVQSTGKIVVAGWSNSSGNFDFAVVRYNADGGRDLSSFGTNGVKKTDIAGLALNDIARAVAVQSKDDKIVVVGNADEHIALVRYTADGELDPTFGPNADGKVTTPLGSGSQANAVAIQPDGKIVIAGIVSGIGFNHGFDIVVARYLDNGTLDTSGFGSFGVTYHHVDIDDAANAVAIYPAVGQPTDGKIVVAGSTNASGGGTRFLILRLDPDGNLDSGFGTGGQVMPDFGSSSSEGYGIAIQPDGKIVAAGTALTVSGKDFALVRVNP